MIINRYIAREIIGSLLTITIVLVTAFLSQQIVRYLNFVAVGKIPTNIILQLIGFEIPSLFALLLPLGLYIGILITYGRLHSDHEMSILQMSGFNTSNILRLTSFIALIATCIVLFIMLFVNPIINLKRQELMTSDQATVHLVQTLIPGRFQASPDGRHVMFVEKISRDHKRAENVFLAQQKKGNDIDNQKNPWTLVLADEGYQEKDKQLQDQVFVTTNGYRYEGMPGRNDYKITQYKKYAIRVQQNDAHVINKDDEALSLTQLWHNYDNPTRAAELQWRISIGLSTFLLALLAVPLSTIKPRQGKYKALLPAILIYIVYINLLFIARHWVDAGAIPISIGMWWVHGVMLIMILIALFLNKSQIRQVFS